MTNNKEGLGAKAFAFFTPREIVLVLNDKDALKAYELLRPTITK
jgi:hypothetical protein